MGNLKDLIAPALAAMYDGKMTRLAKAVGTKNSGSLGRAIDSGRMDLVQCLRLSKATGVSASTILRAVGRTEAANLIEALYGDDKTVISDLDRRWLQLAHKLPGPYNRARHWDARVTMMQAWADHLDGLREQATGRRAAHKTHRRGVVR